MSFNTLHRVDRIGNFTVVSETDVFLKTEEKKVTTNVVYNAALRTRTNNGQ